MAITIYDIVLLIILQIIIFLLLLSIHKEVLRRKDQTHKLEIIAERQKVRDEETTSKLEMLERLSKC